MIRGIDLVKIYQSEGSEYQIAALRGCDFQVKEGEFVSLVGPSGAGKTTLLRILGGIERPSSGQIYLDNESLANKSPSQLRSTRRNKIGFVSQSAEQNLIRGLSVRKNLELAMRIKRLPREVIRKRIRFLLHTLALDQLENRNVAVLSGGEIVRTSVAAALAKEPKIVLADEPTGNLDSAMTIVIRKMFREISRESGVAIIVATHDLRFRIEVDRSLTISDGRLVRIEGEFPPTISPEEQTRFMAYVDSTGFIQIPPNIRDHLGLKETVVLELDSSREFAILRPSEKKRTANHYIQSLPPFSKPDLSASLSGKRVTLAALAGVSMTYGSGERKVDALRDINLNISQGEFVAIVGPSGSGKSTLLHILAGLEKPTSGEVTLSDQALTKSSNSSRAALRAQKIGLVVERANLHPSLSVLDNIALPLLLLGQDPNRKRAIEMLKACGMENRLDSLPRQLSEGEKQRVSVVAALIHRPSLVILDEPTSHLESLLGRRIIDLILREAERNNIAVVLATHDLALLRSGFRIVALDSGMKVTDQLVDTEMHKRLIQEFYGMEIR
ncbi:MAG: ABC transporter ATP-binding protein [Candidatus Hodarchaeales archaeon]|jgi:putative ABC transport system ATP-binding protein